MKITSLRRLLFCCSILVVLPGCSGEKKETVVVTVIEKTKTYHRKECAPVHMARTIDMSLSEAKTKKLKACPVCKPDLQ